MRVKLKDRHFLHGVQRSTTECPLALCLKDLGYEDVCVSHIVSTIDGQKYSHSQETEAALMEYDSTGEKALTVAVMTRQGEPDSLLWNAESATYEPLPK